MSTSSLPHTAVPRQSTEKNACIYARVSTTDQADNGYSLPTQIEACHALAAQQEYHVDPAHLFTDDYTGTSLNRPQLRRLRELVRSGAVQTVLVHDLDRLSRRLVHQLILTEEFERAGVALLVVTMPRDTKTPEGQLLVNVQSVLAEYEREKLRERTLRGLRGRAQAGKPPGGTVPLGYRYHNERYEIDEGEARLVRRIFAMYIEEGLSINAIVKRLTAERVPTHSDRRQRHQKKLGVGIWHGARVHGVLTSETYIGTLYYNKTERIASAANPDKKTRWRQRPREEWIEIPVPPIITQGVFDATQAQTRRNAAQSRRNMKYDYLLSGRLVCGACKRRMHGQCDVRTMRRFYKCTRPPWQLETPCRGEINAETLEATVWHAVEAALNNPALITDEVADRHAHAGEQHGELVREREALERQLARCERDMVKWEAAYLDEVIDLADFKVKKADITTQQAALEAEVARVIVQRQQLEQHEAQTTMLESYITRVRDQLTTFTFAEKRKALEPLNIMVTWHRPNRFEIAGNIDFEPLTVGEIAYDAPSCMGAPGARAIPRRQTAATAP
jgi:site-specific DNA recombinase